MNSVACIMLILVLLTGCNGNPPAKEAASKSNSGTSFIQLNKTDTAQDHPVYDSIIYVHFKSGSNEATVQGFFKEMGQPVTVIIPVENGSTLHAQLTPAQDTANIRINQVVLPSGKADGPFGRTIDVPVVQKGIYKLLLGADLMAGTGEAWKGPFSLHVVLQ